MNSKSSSHGNRVEYFVSYFDYYQPEAYIASSDTYIEKDSAVNDEIDKLRHSATASLFETRDVIIVASVSCIYGLGDPIDYENLTISLRPGMKIERNAMLNKLVDLQYSRNELDFKRGTFRAKGDIVEIYPSEESETAIRVEFWGDEVEKISEKYTSGVSAIDEEEIVKENYNIKRRIYRGLFVTNKGKRINADVNGSLNILRKYIKSKTELEIVMNNGREQLPIKKRVA